MTELEKCNAGLPYRFDNPEMVARKTAAIRECERFNGIDGTDYEAQCVQLKKDARIRPGSGLDRQDLQL